MNRWCIIITRGDGTTELMHETYSDEATAKMQAERRCGWYRCVQVGIAPLNVDLTQLQPIEPNEHGLQN